MVNVLDIDIARKGLLHVVLKHGLEVGRARSQYASVGFEFDAASVHRDISAKQRKSTKDTLAQHVPVLARRKQ